MKLLADARTLASKPSGVGMYLYNYIRALSDATDWEILLVSDVAESDEIRELVRSIRKSGKNNAFANVSAYEKTGRAAIRVMGDGTRTVAKSAGVFRYFRFVQRVIDEERPDIFWEPNNVFPTRLKNPYGQIVTTVHDVLPMTFPECYTRIYPFYFRWAMRNTLKRSDAILYDSEVTKNETESFFKDASGKKSLIAYAIVDVGEARGGGDENAGEIVGKGGDYFLYIGNLERRKGTDILIRAYEKYKKAGGDKRLILAGKAREREIGALIEEAAARSGITYLGYVDDEQKKELYRNCYAYVFPTRAEGFGMPVIEALSFKKPVIASDLPIIREIAPVGVTWFDMKDDNATVERLAEKMNEKLLCPSDEEMEDTKERYSPCTLERRLVDFMEDIR